MSYLLERRDLPGVGRDAGRRLILYRRQFARDFQDFDRRPGFFTIVAGTAFEEGMNGGWLISVVATQGIANLGARISAQFPPYRSEMLFFALALWLAGACCIFGDRADLLSLHVLPIPPAGFHPALLDQHGRDGDLHTGGFRCWRSWHIGNT